MAEDTENFPVLAARQWWALRDRFKKSMPGTISPAYLASTLSLQEKHARDVLTALRYLGIIDAEGKTTPLTEEWRHDDTYAAACKVMLESVYPEELRHAAPGPDVDRGAAERWFARRKQVGENMALKMAIVYELVARATIPSPGEAAKPAQRSRAEARPPARSRARAAERDPEPDPKPPATPAAQRLQNTGGPSVHIDVQIHIAADANAAQIDQIFASMAKHLYAQPKQSNG